MSWPRRFFGKVLGSSLRSELSNVLYFRADDSDRFFRLASDPEAVPKRSKLARSAVWADSYLQVGALRLLAAIALIADSRLQ